MFFLEIFPGKNRAPAAYSCRSQLFKDGLLSYIHPDIPVISGQIYYPGSDGGLSVVMARLRGKINTGKA